MYKFHCLNNISPIGLKNFTSQYEQVSDIEDAHGILVRSAAMHDMEFSDNLLAIARAAVADAHGLSACLVKVVFRSLVF